MSPVEDTYSVVTSAETVGFPSSSTIDILGQPLLCWGGSLCVAGSLTASLGSDH